MSRNSPTVLLWFRQDLRLQDNPALVRAARAGRVLPVYILDDECAAEHRIGGAGRWWLHCSLASLNKSLGGKLRLYRARADSLLPHLAEMHGVEAIFWNRCYKPWRVARDTAIRTELTARGIGVESDNGALLWEPWEVLKRDGTPYRVFTPFFCNGCLNAEPPRKPLAVPTEPDLVDHEDPLTISLEALRLLPHIRWDRSLEPHWTIGEAGAKRRLDHFLSDGLGNYKHGRDYPALNSVSRLSPHLHWGEISPHKVWHAASLAPPSAGLEHFRSELGWREFSYSLLYHFPDLPSRNLQHSFDAFPWRSDANLLRRWQSGETVIPIVDAGMREFWQTGQTNGLML